MKVLAIYMMVWTAHSATAFWCLAPTQEKLWDWCFTLQSSWKISAVKAPLSLCKWVIISQSHSLTSILAIIVSPTDTSQGCSQGPKPKQALYRPKAITFLNRGSTNTSHHKKCDLRKTWIVFHRKHFTVQWVFHIKILHFTESIFYIKPLMSQISFYTRKLYKQSNMTAKWLHGK